MDAVGDVEESDAKRLREAVSLTDLVTPMSHGTKTDCGLRHGLDTLWDTDSD